MQFSGDYSGLKNAEKGGERWLVETRLLISVAPADGNISAGPWSGLSRLKIKDADQLGL